MDFNLDLLPVLFFVLLILGAGGLVLSHQRRIKKRAADLLSFAQDRGFSFQSDDKSDERMCMKYSFFKSFTMGRERKASNIISFQEGEKTVTFFDYQYTTGSGKNRSTRQSSNIIVYHSDKCFPHFFIRREIAVFDFLGKMFGGQDINFDDDEEFSKSFVLQGNSEEETRSFFENSEHRFPFLIFADESVTFEGTKQYVHYQQPELISADDLSEKMQQFQDLVSALD